MKQHLFNIMRWVAAIIMLQTLFFKFTAAQESVYIFKTLGIEPWGRIGTGIVELIASLLILYRKTSWIGATIGIFLMLGAIMSHFLYIGIEIFDDNGKLFILALITLFCCLGILFFEKDHIRAFLGRSK